MGTQYLTITDGTTSALFADGATPPGDTNYKVAAEGWAPAQGGLSLSPLASAGLFVDVVEDLLIHIKGATAAAAMLNWQTLSALLDQAERWYLRRDNAAVVEMRYSPEGATVSSPSEPLRAPIYGRAPGDASCLQLPPEFTGPLLTDGKYIVNGRMRFVRRGWWTLTTVQTVTSTSQTNGDLHTLAFGAALKYPSVTKLRINGVRSGLNVPSGLLAMSEKANGIIILNAEGAVPATDYSSVANGTQLARNTNVLRFTPTVVTERKSSNINFTSETDARLFAVFINQRNNSTTTSFNVRISIFAGATIAALEPQNFTPRKLIPGTANSRPEWTFVGSVSLQVQPTGLFVHIQASAISGSFDIDSIVLVDLTNHSQVIEVRNDATGVAAGDNTYRYVVDPRLLISESGGFGPHRPVIYFVTGTTTDVIPYVGNLYLPTRTTTIYAVWLGTGGSVSQDRWRQATIADALLSGTMVADRYISYVSPE